MSSQGGEYGNRFKSKNGKTKQKKNKSHCNFSFISVQIPFDELAVTNYNLNDIVTPVKPDVLKFCC